MTEHEKTQPLNVLIQPDSEVRHQAIAWCEVIARRYPTAYVLDDDRAIVHLTLYQTEYPTRNRQQIERQLVEIASQAEPFDIELAGLRPYIGHIFYEAERANVYLSSLHKKIAERLNPLREDHITDNFREMMEMDDVPDERKQNIKTWGYPDFGSLYSPHITLTRLTDYRLAQQAIKLVDPRNLKFRVTQIALGECGPDGVCPRIIRTFPFGQKP